MINSILKIIQGWVNIKGASDGTFIGNSGDSLNTNVTNLLNTTIKGGTDGTIIGNTGDSLNANITNPVTAVVPTGLDVNNFPAVQPVSSSDLSSIDSKLSPLGQNTMANSTPVVIASDQTGVPVTSPDLTSIDNKTPSLGQQAMASSTPVVIASNQTAVPISSSALTNIDNKTPALISGKQPVAISDGLGNAITSSAAGAQRPLDVQLHGVSGNPVGTAANPLRVDPTGTTTQPVSSFSIDGLLTSIMSILKQIANPISMDAISGRMRVVLDPIGGAQTLGTVTAVGTVTTVTTVSTVSSVTSVAALTTLQQIANVPANSFIYDTMSSAWALNVRGRIS